MKKTKLITKLLLVVLFFGCLWDMPYGYFQLVRAVGMAAFLLLYSLENKVKRKHLVAVWLGSAILINPFLKLPLGRTIWNIVDVAWIAIIIWTIATDLIAYRKETSG